MFQETISRTQKRLISKQLVWNI